MNSLLKNDYKRYSSRKEMPKWQIRLRKCQESKCKITFLYNCLLYKRLAKKSLVEISTKASIGPGLFVGHPHSITINTTTIIGKNCNIHKGVTIGQENRGPRKGTPIIGDEVWIGINSTVVGNIKIGNDVLIAPNSYVNCDIPDHSIVIGNPCIIKHKDNATKNYINRQI